jgi:hypothetical protein
MKRVWLAVIFVLASVPAAVRAQGCDCTIVPFTPNPPCKSKCKKAMTALANATSAELQLIVGLDKTVATAIANWKGRSKAESLKDYSTVLNADAVKEVSRKFNSLSDAQVAYFEKPLRERLLIREQLFALIRDQ